LEAVSKDVPYVVMALPATKHCKAALMSDGGIFDSAKKGTYILDTSTISPIGAKEFNTASKKHGMLYIDSPMSGGTAGARL